MHIKFTIEVNFEGEGPYKILDTPTKEILSV